MIPSNFLISQDLILNESSVVVASVPFVIETVTPSTSRGPSQVNVDVSIF